jgi:DNA-binding XRE family transcriptional regulator
MMILFPNGDRIYGGVKMKLNVKTKVKPNGRIRAAMIESGYTQETLANVIGIGHSTFNIKLNGKRDFTIPEGIRIAKATHRTLDEIFFNQSVPDWEQREVAK